MLFTEIEKMDLKLLIALSRGTQGIHRRSATLFKEHGLTIAQFSVLEALYHKGDLTINEIIMSVLSTSGNMTVVISNLEKECFIERIVNEKDKRSCIIRITEKGRKSVENIFPSHVADLGECFSVYTNDEKQELLELLRRLKK